MLLRLVDMPSPYLEIKISENLNEEVTKMNSIRMTNIENLPRANSGQKIGKQKTITRWAILTYCFTTNIK